MKIYNVKEYLQKHHVEQIKIGQSGAKVYVIDNSYILKHVTKKQVSDENVWESYLREIKFYEEVNSTMLECIPKVIYSDYNNEEAVLLMKRYRMVEHHEINHLVLNKALKALSMVHTSSIPLFLQTDENTEHLLSKEQIKECIEGWSSVLEEHKGIFEKNHLLLIAKCINTMIQYQQKAKKTLVHGDFHCENLFFDEANNIMIGDWQGVGIGNPASELSFFISRLLADGITIEEEAVLNLYRDNYLSITDEKLDATVIRKDMIISEILTTFLFWHNYLHGSSEDRVRGIYERMIIGFQTIRDSFI